MTRLKITLAYQGTHYAGWQMQARKENPPRTIQSEMEKVFTKIVGTRIVVHGAGRTDSGVHAEAQVCHVDLPETFVLRHSGNTMNWLRALNGNLPLDIRVLQIEEVPLSFHARKSALQKTYAYSLWSDMEQAIPRLAPFVWSVHALDVDKMLCATKHLVGKKDFAVFQKRGTDVESTVRTVFSIEPLPHTIGLMSCPVSWPVTTWYVQGDGFLRQMVRNIMGLLVWVGLGKIDVAQVPSIIASQDRTKLPSPAAPSHGLTLLSVKYS